MTAEIAILNREAIAMATDSAVTVRRGKLEKIYPSANKIFALSKHHPIGIMVYGGAHFMDIPWETVIKTYRSKLDKKSFKSLENYSANFIAHLQRSKQLSNKKSELRHIEMTIYSYFYKVALGIRDEIEKELGKVPKLTRLQIEIIVSYVIQHHYELWRQSKQVRKNFKPPGAIKILTGRVSAIVKKAIPLCFEQIPLSTIDKQRVSQIAKWLFYKIPDHISTPNESGVVIAGFGENDLFPCLQHYRVIGRVGELFQASQKSSANITDDTDGIIIPFAQRDVVKTFMEGINPDYQQILNEFTRKALLELPKRIANKYPLINNNKIEKVEKDIVQVIEETLNGYIQTLVNIRMKYFAEPVYKSVASLPKEQLADMAESLVNLTSFRKRITMDSESVGGPVDVAVISKGDGLVWIKRKHYFSSDLNHHFFKNYFGVKDHE